MISEQLRSLTKDFNEHYRYRLVMPCLTGAKDLTNTELNREVSNASNSK